MASVSLILFLVLTAAKLVAAVVFVRRRRRLVRPIRRPNVRPIVDGKRIAEARRVEPLAA